MLSMNWDAIGAIGEIAGALAVVVTLLFLSRQIRETARQIHLNSATEVNSLFNDAFDPIYNNEHNLTLWVEGQRNPASLSEDDLAVFFLFVTRLMAVFDTVVEHFQHGTIPVERFDNYRNFILLFINSAGGQAWLKAGIYKFSAATSEVLELS